MIWTIHRSPYQPTGGNGWFAWIKRATPPLFVILQFAGQTSETEAGEIVEAMLAGLNSKSRVRAWRARCDACGTIHTTNREPEESACPNCRDQGVAPPGALIWSEVEIIRQGA